MLTKILPRSLTESSKHSKVAFNKSVAAVCPGFTLGFNPFCHVVTKAVAMNIHLFVCLFSSVADQNRDEYTRSPPRNPGRRWEDTVQVSHSTCSRESAVWLRVIVFMS